MIRLRVLVEGDTEEAFVQEILASHLLGFGVEVTATGVGATKGGRGIVKWRNALQHISNSLRGDSRIHVTTLIDYYALPACWPGRTESSSMPFSRRAAFMAEKIAQAVRMEMGPDWRGTRFIPNVLIHEFETLLFSNPEATARALGMAALSEDMHAVLRKVDSPEEINDGYETCPSRRISKIVEKFGRTYEKPLHGNIAILDIGLGTIRQKCPQFGAWLRQLEDLGSTITGDQATRLDSQ